VAVFPDRIVLKNSTDDEATIESLIQVGGLDEISPGELVLGLQTGYARLYTKDAVGSIVSISGGGAGGTGGGAGRGDGGNFDDGSVEALFAFGVYGGGDFSSGTDDIPIELLGGGEGPDGGSF